MCVCVRECVCVCTRARAFVRTCVGACVGAWVCSEHQSVCPDCRAPILEDGGVSLLHDMQSISRLSRFSVNIVHTNKLRNV